MNANNQKIQHLKAWDVIDLTIKVRMNETLQF